MYPKAIERVNIRCHTIAFEIFISSIPFVFPNPNNNIIICKPTNVIINICLLKKSNPNKTHLYLIILLSLNLIYSYQFYHSTIFTNFDKNNPNEIKSQNSTALIIGTLMKVVIPNNTIKYIATNFKFPFKVLT